MPQNFTWYSGMTFCVKWQAFKISWVVVVCFFSESISPTFTSGSARYCAEVSPCLHSWRCEEVNFEASCMHSSWFTAVGLPFRMSCLGIFNPHVLAQGFFSVCEVMKKFIHSLSVAAMPFLPHPDSCSRILMLRGLQTPSSFAVFYWGLRGVSGWLLVGPGQSEQARTPFQGALTQPRRMQQSDHMLLWSTFWLQKAWAWQSVKEASVTLTQFNFCQAVC